MRAIDIFRILVLAAIVILLMTTGGQAQVIVSGKPIPQDINYVGVVTFTKGMSKMVADVDYGQIKKGKFRITADGEPKVFNGTIHVINFMVENGWEYVETLEYTAGLSKNHAHIFRRKDV